MTLFRTFALTVLLASPAAADPAADYLRMREALPTILFSGDQGLQSQAQSAVLQQLQGRWVTVSLLMEDGVTFPDSALISQACGAFGFDIIADGSFALTLVSDTKPDPFTIRLTNTGGSTYLSTMEEAGFMARFFPGQTAEDVPPDSILPIMTDSAWMGYVSLMPLGDDLLLVQPQSHPPELLARCD